MKPKFVFLLFSLTVFCISCDNDDPDGFDSFELLWTPSLYQSTIADGSVILKWPAFEKSLISDIETKCIAPNYVNPDRFEVYQSDNMMDNFVMIAEFDNKNKPITFTVSNLTNGKPVYFRVHSVRRKYDTMQSSTFEFIPNPEPKTEILFTSDKSNINQLTISPDGTKMAYVDYDDNKRVLCLSDIEGTGKVGIMENGSFPVWNNENNKIYFDVSSYNCSKIMCYDCETKGITQITQNVLFYRGFSISPDESKLLYELNQNGGLNLYVYDIQNAKDSLIMSRDMNGKWLEYSEPLWVDNDNYLVKKSRVNVPYSTNLSLVSYKEDKVEDIITDYEHFFSFAVLSPDKKNVAYISYLNNYPHLFVYNISTQSSRQLTGYEGVRVVDSRPHLIWKDNDILYYTDISHTDGQQRIVSVSID